jgi:hypothetical protein
LLACPNWKIAYLLHVVGYSSVANLIFTRFSATVKNIEPMRFCLAEVVAVACLKTRVFSMRYALCSGSGGPTDFSGLYTMSLDDPLATPVFSYSLTGMSLPNGMVATPSGVYVTDGPVAIEPKIVHLTIDPADPTRVLAQDTWLSSLPDYPNGLAHHEGVLYVTFYRPGFGGQVTRLVINPDGTPGEPENIAPRGIMDDLTVVGDSLIVTDWQNGGLFQIDLAGGLLQETASNIYAQPSSVTIAGPPLFDEASILVTERYTGDGLWVLE